MVAGAELPPPEEPPDAGVAPDPEPPVGPEALPPPDTVEPGGNT